MLFNDAPALKTSLDAETREDRAQVFERFGRGTDGCRFIRGSLTRRDGGAGERPFDGVDVGLLEGFDKRARVRRQTFEKASLAIGV